MSLILNHTCSQQLNPPDDCRIEDLRDAAAIDRYLAILEANKASSAFVPNDALLTLDMAGFVSGAIRNSHPSQPVSVNRLALALMQAHRQPTPVQ